MKVSQELSISFWLRKDARNPDNPATINLRIIDGERDGFSLGYQVDPKKFNRKAAEVIGKSIEAIEINKHILYVKGELIRHYNLLKEQGSTITPTMLKNAYLGIDKERKTLLQALDFHNAKFKEKVDKEKRSGQHSKNGTLPRIS